MKHVEERFGPESNKEVLLLCIGITSCIGRFIFGRVADYIPGVNKVYLQVSTVFSHPDLQNPSFLSRVNQMDGCSHQKTLSRGTGTLQLEERGGGQDQGNGGRRRLHRSRGTRRASRRLQSNTRPSSLLGPSAAASPHGMEPDLCASRSSVEDAPAGCSHRSQSQT